MNVYLNLWGGEGYLSCATVLAMASVGAFDNIVDSSGAPVTIKYGCFDFTKPDNADRDRCIKMYEAYKNYYCDIINENVPAAVVNTAASINNMAVPSNPRDLATKYSGEKKFLAFGCSQSDITTNLEHGIYGKPWVGEAYYADSTFGIIYNGDPNTKLVINCGGYKGGGTAATFIPLENVYQAPNAERFDIIVGPSTQFNTKVCYPNTGIYPVPTYDNGVDLFEIPKVLAELDNYSKAIPDQSAHQQNKAFLEDKYKEIYDPYHHGGSLDRRSLNPVNYMPRFVDRVESDKSISNLKACFINLKPNLTRDISGNIKYDITSEMFQPDEQLHRLHITNLISAVEVKEIAENHGSYNSPGAIYTFQQPTPDFFTLDGVIGNDDANKVTRFLVFSVIVTEFLFNAFDNIQMPVAGIMLDKWAQTTKKNLFSGHMVAMPPNPVGELNNKFAIQARQYFVDLAHKFIKPILETLIDIHDTCDDVKFFSEGRLTDTLTNGTYGVVQDMLGKIYVDKSNPNNVVQDIRPERDAAVARQRLQERVAALIMGRFNIDNDYARAFAWTQQAKNIGFLNSFQMALPEFGVDGGHGKRTWDPAVNDSNVADYAEKYCKLITKETYKYLRDTFI